MLSLLRTIYSKSGLRTEISVSAEEFEVVYMGEGYKAIKCNYEISGYIKKKLYNSDDRQC